MRKDRRIELKHLLPPKTFGLPKDCLSEDPYSETASIVWKKYSTKQLHGLAETEVTDTVTSSAKLQEACWKKNNNNNKKKNLNPDPIHSLPAPPPLCKHTCRKFFHRQSLIMMKRNSADIWGQGYILLLYIFKEK